ncbi:hypothetical protein EMPG_11562 [Blastomyces silverae]|uniref:Uncharacterized protein n=1 Tax=Blastomyces silverae TaxID=2060906 RepID=A0A0H1BWQ2_9EURO|nr:hypothetical protein EMPG_11562 [Blastomyces silverae]
MGHDVLAQYSCGHPGILNVHTWVVPTLGGKPLMVEGPCPNCVVEALAYTKVREERERRNKEAEEAEEYKRYKQG